ncbi:hypothetical protein ACLB2K_022454 [Fragaria x ananassa]
MAPSRYDALATMAVKRLNQLMEDMGHATTDFRVLIPDSTSQQFVLGPALKSEHSFPDNYSEFPKRKTEGFLIHSQNAKFYEWFHTKHRFWPGNDPDWVSWFERVQAQKSYVWHQAGIYDILQFSKFTIPLNRSLVLAALCFWSTSTNSFHFGHGPLTITLLDLSALVGLRPCGAPFDVVVADSIPIPDDICGIQITQSPNFPSFIREHNKIEGAVTDEEHVAFLHYWLCRYLLCSPSFKIIKANLPLAVALSRGESYALGPVVLAYLYRGINDLLHSQLNTTGGPLWILQLWLHAYFPEMRPDCFAIPNLSCHGLKYVSFKEPKLSFHDCLLFMYHLDREENFNFNPYSKLDALPPWLIFPWSEMSETEFSKLKDMWASFLVSRDLPVGISLPKFGHKTFGFEVYCPNLCARQFGLIQGIPTPPFFSLSTHFLEKISVGGFEEQLQLLKVTTAQLLTKLELSSYSPLPSTSSSFKTWWTKYYKQVFPHDLHYLVKLDDMTRNRTPRQEPAEKAIRNAFRKRKVEIPIQDSSSHQQRVPEPGRSRKRIRYVDKQGICSSVKDEKEMVPEIQCLRGQGRIHSKTRMTIKACHFLRSIRKGNYLCHTKFEEAARKNKQANRPSKNQFQIAQGKSCGKKSTPIEEAHCCLMNLTDSHSQFLSEATRATFQKKTCPQSKHQNSDAVCVGLVVESTEDNINFQVNDRPLTETMDASNDRLTSQISSPPTEAADPQTPQSPFHAPSSHPNPSGSHTIRDPEVSKPTNSIQALEFLECYLHKHSYISNLVKAEQTPIPDSEVISEAKVKIQSISTLPLDKVMETECLQSFKLSLETLVRSNDQTGVQLLNIEDVLRKLAFLESKYPSASGITTEVNKAYVQKLQLEHEVTEYTNQISEAKKEEAKFLNCVDIQKSIVEELETKLAEEKASLIALEKYHATYKCKIDELNYKCEQSQQMLGHHCINERIWVNKALQARSDFKSIEATWVQIQHLLSSIGGSKQGNFSTSMRNPASRKDQSSFLCNVDLQAFMDIQIRGSANILGTFYVLGAGGIEIDGLSPKTPMKYWDWGRSQLLSGSLCKAGAEHCCVESSVADYSTLSYQRNEPSSHGPVFGRRSEGGSIPNARLQSSWSGWNVAILFQKYWDLVGVELSNAVISFLTTKDMPHDLNYTNVVLILKVKEVQHMTELRPIALCNVVYKIASKQLFPTSNVNTSLALPISSREHQDRWIWSENKLGKFSVKTSYHLARKHVLDHEHVPNPSSLLWNKLWKVKVPSKVKVCAWKVASNILPTRSRFSEQGVDIDTQCPFCEEEVESPIHALRDCSHATKCLQLAQVPLLPNTTLVYDWLVSALSIPTIFPIMLMILWAIWRNRNQKKPSVGFVKLNVDAAFDPNTGRTGLGGVFHDHEGRCLGVFTKFIVSASSPQHSELLAVLEGVG